MSTRSLSLDIADALDTAEQHDGVTLGISDSALAARALRAQARRDKNRVRAKAALFGLTVASAAAPIPSIADVLDYDRDGSVTVVDVHHWVNRIANLGRKDLAVRRKFEHEGKIFVLEFEPSDRPDVDLKVRSLKRIELPPPAHEG